VTVRGDGDTDLDLYIVNENGVRVAYDDDLSDHCVAVWMPPRTGRYFIRVVNLGDVYNRYRICFE
jgi:hypothetical protein